MILRARAATKAALMTFERPIVIIGAGIGGLSLGQCLRRHDIKSIIYEKARREPRNAYGLNLNNYHRAESDKIPKYPQSMVVQDHAEPAPSRNSGKSYPPIRVNRTRLESFLSESLDIRWEHKLENIERDVNDAWNIRFSNGQTCQGNMVIAADGVHSQIRGSLLPNTPVQILPYVVFNSRRRISIQDWQKIYEPHFRYQKPMLTLEHLVSKNRLQISVDDFKLDEVDINCTFSRPASNEDELHNPGRSFSQAQTIPEKLFEELFTLQSRMSEPFSHAFDPENLRNSRLLHWLMRSLLVDRQDLDSLANSGIAFIGDAAHASPIVGSNGATEAMEDASQLASIIAEADMKPFASFYEQRYSNWIQLHKNAESKFAQIHQRPEKLA